MAGTDDVSFWEMYSELPVRTTLVSVGPVVLAVAQLANGYANGVPVTHTGAFAAVVTVAAVLVTRYHLVEFRRLKLQRDIFGDG